jgi:hypothetical protein
VSTPLVRFWYAVAVSFLACMAVAAGSVAYTAYSQERNDRRWCSLLIQLTDAQRKTPPPTQSGKQFAAELERLRAEFHCKR